MEIFLTYHTLEERDTHHISRVWKWLIIILLLAAIFTSMATSYCIYALEYVFDMNCFLYAKLHLPEVTEGCPALPRPELLHYTVYSTIWGHRQDCDYAVLMPLCQAFSSAVVASVFMVFGRGGASVSGLLPRPWVIVMPSTLFFAGMTFLSFVYTQFVHQGMVKLCEELTKQYPQCDCFVLLNMYQVQEFGMINGTINRDMYSMMRPSETYVALHIYMYVAFIMYACTVGVMILRCLCMTDFKLVRVTIASYDGDLKALFREQAILKLRRAVGKKRASFCPESEIMVNLEMDNIIDDAVTKAIHNETLKISAIVELELELDFETMRDSDQSILHNKKEQ